MPISPLAELIIGAGVLGGARALGTRRQNDRFAAGLLNASQLSGLPQGQILAIAEIARQDPSMAMQLLQSQQNAHIQRQQFEFNARRAGAADVRAEAQLDLAQEKGAREQSLFDLAAQQRAAGAPLQGPGPGQRRVFGAGGQFERDVPIAGTKDFIAAETALGKAAGRQARINELQQILQPFITGDEQVGFSERDPRIGRIQSLVASLQLDFKDVTGAGALDEGLLNVARSVIDDPTGLSNNFRTNAATVLSRLEPFAAETGRDLQQAFANIRGFEGLNQQGLDFATDTLQVQQLVGPSVTRAVNEAQRQRSLAEAPALTPEQQRIRDTQAVGDAFGGLLGGLQNIPIIGSIFGN